LTAAPIISPAPDRQADLAVPERRARHRRALAGTIGAILVVGLVGTHLLLGARLKVPIIHPDEFGYVYNARHLALGGARPDTQYYPGFSLLLTPFWLVTRAPLTVWRGALVLNAVAAGLAGLVTWALCRRLIPRLGAAPRLAITALVCLYPPFLLYSNMALSECLFVLVFGIVVLIAAEALPGTRPGWWAALGLASGGLTLIHPRGLAVVVAVVVMGAVVLRPWRAGARATVALGAGLTLSLAVTRVLVSATRGTLPGGGSAYNADTIVNKSLSAHGLPSLVWEAAGQLFYLSVATFGLVPLGLVLGLRSLRAVGKGDRTAVELVRAFSALAFLGVWVLSSLFMNLGTRIDKLIYGRYNEGVIVPLLVMALAEVVGPGRHRGSGRRHHAAGWWALAGTTTIAITGTALLVGRSRAELHGELNPVNVLGIYPLLRHYHGVLDVMAVSVIGVTVVVALAVMAWRLPVAAAIVLAALFVFLAVDNERTYFIPGSRSRAEQGVIATTLLRAGRQFNVANQCVGYDPYPPTDYNYYNTRFLTPGRQYAWFEAASGGRPCGPLVISSDRNFAARFPGARLITVEDDVEQSLWVLPGALQSRMNDAGWLLPSPPGPLPDAARHAVLVTADRQASVLTVPSGATRTLRVSATHDGAGSPWPAEAGLQQAAFAVRLAVRWYLPGDLPADPADPGRAAVATVVQLSRTTLPGETATFSVPLTARADARTPLPPGRYEVRLTLYQQSAPAFTDPGLVIDTAVR
jgi:hypothetical protein